MLYNKVKIVKNVLLKRSTLKQYNPASYCLLRKQSMSWQILH